MFGRSVLAGLAVVPKLRMFGRSVPVGLAVVPKLRTFSRSVPVGLAVAPKFRIFGRSVPVEDPKVRTFGRNAPMVLVRVPKSQALDLNGLRLVHRHRVVQDVLKVHNDPTIRLARAAGIVTRLARVRITQRDNNPAMQLARVVDIVTRLAHVRLNRRNNNRSRRRDLGQRGAGVGAPSPAGGKVIRASAIALSREGDLGRSKNAQC
jgi:hypothetical protein